jgi:uncharacterized repeat protein (TIGR02543 family)
MVFTAQWSPISYAITWDSACHSVGACTPASGLQTSYTAGQQIAAPTSNPSETGWEFAAWTSSNANVGNCLPTTPISTYGNVTFTAQWNAVHTVTWDSNCPPSTPCTSASGGASTIGDGSVFYGPTAPSATGWDFTGWLATTGAVQFLPTFNQYVPLTPYGDIVLTAQWSPKT